MTFLIQILLNVTKVFKISGNCIIYIRVRIEHHTSYYLELLGLLSLNDLKTRMD